MLKEIEDVKKNYTPEMFVDQTPDHFSSSGDPMPRWRRLLMARKICEAAKEQKIAEIKVNIYNT